MFSFLKTRFNKKLDTIKHKEKLYKFFNDAKLIDISKSFKKKSFCMIMHVNYLFIHLLVFQEQMGLEKQH